jgi:hypothetical protein
MWKSRKEEALDYSMSATPVDKPSARAIIHCSTDFPIDYVAVEGMEFEIRFRFPDRVRNAGGIEAYKKSRDTSPASWLHRIRTAEQISDTAISTYDELCKNT